MLSKTPARAGPEMLLRSMGLGDVIEAAQRFASAGTVDKITGFADNLGAYIAQAQANERLLRRIADHLGISAAEYDASNGGTIAPDTEPGLPVARGLATDHDGGSGANGSVEPGSTASACGDADATRGASDETG